MLTEIINGDVVIVPAAEEVAIRAAWQAADAAQAQTKVTEYLDQRNLALAAEVGQLMTLLFNDIAAGTPLNAGTFYAAVQAVNDKYKKPV